MSKPNNNNIEPVKVVCPTIQELCVISTQVRCKKCNMTFCNESSLRMHDVKVHQKKKLEKVVKENVQYRCPINSCIYSVNSVKHFVLFKYLKQHYLKVHAEKSLKCSHCLKSYSTKAAYEAHLRICGTIFTCECGKTYDSYESLLTHARRTFHKISEKYKSKRITKKQNLESNIVKHSSSVCTNYVEFIPIIPKPTCEVGIQTEERLVKKKTKCKKIKGHQICRQTQTNDSSKDKQPKKVAQTQTSKTAPCVISVHQSSKLKQISNAENSKVKEVSSFVKSFGSGEYASLSSALDMKHDVVLQDLWEEKSTLGTQTSPEKRLFDEIDDSNTNNSNFNRMTRSDPMLTEQVFNSIETQTEKALYDSLFVESDTLSTHIETQTTENFTEPLHIYSNICTQTCDEILSTDLELADIQTQTAWNHVDESTVSTETQTKTFKCISGCDSNSWFTTQTNHMETQTDLFNIFEDLS